MEDVLIVVIVVLLLFTSVGFVVLRDTYEKKLEDVRASYEKKADYSAKISKSVVNGFVAEQLYPVFYQTRFTPSEMRFLGQPFDYIILRGLDEGDVKEVIFADVKTGAARLTPVQRTIKQCIESGNVTWETIRIGDTTHE